MLDVFEEFLQNMTFCSGQLQRKISICIEKGNKNRGFTLICLVER